MRRRGARTWAVALFVIATSAVMPPSAPSPRCHDADASLHVCHRSPSHVAGNWLPTWVMQWQRKQDVITDRLPLDNKGLFRSRTQTPVEKNGVLAGPTAERIATPRLDTRRGRYNRLDTWNPNTSRTPSQCLPPSSKSKI